MDELRGVIEQAMGEANHMVAGKLRPEERKPRAHAIATLFVLYGVEDPVRASAYLLATEPIPLDKLKAAVQVIVRSHHWPSLPVVADIWRAARLVAGMDREQHKAGRYLRAPREWPPDGKRYGVQHGEFESLGPELAINSVPLTMIEEEN